MYFDRADIGLYQPSPPPCKRAPRILWFHLEAVPSVKVQTDVCIFLTISVGRHAEGGKPIHQRESESYMILYLKIQAHTVKTYERKNLLVAACRFFSER